MKNERWGCIYILVCLANGKGYVGQTIKPHVEMRWAEHVKTALKGSRKPLYAAMRKYGLCNFTAHVLHTCKESKLNAAETRFVKQCNTFIDRGYGYNLTTGGNCFRLAKRSVRKIRRSLIKYYKANPGRLLNISAQSSARMSSKVVRDQLSKAVLEGWDTVARKKMSRFKRRQYAENPSIGKKISKSAIKQWAKPGARIKKSLISKRGWEIRRKNGTDRVVYGKHSLHSKRAKANMIAAQLKRFEDPAECKKISDGQLRRYQNPEAHAKSSVAQYKRFAEHPMSAETNAKIAKKTSAAFKDPIMGLRMRAALARGREVYWARAHKDRGFSAKPAKNRT